MVKNMSVSFSYFVLAFFFVLILLFLSNYLKEGFYQPELVPEMGVATLYCCDNRSCSTTPCNGPNSIIKISL